MIRFEIKNASLLRIDVAADKTDMQVKDAVVSYVNGEPYDGPYEVIPKADEAQILPTKQRILAEDMTVLAVPYYEADNQIGTTIYIASEV